MPPSPAAKLELGGGVYGKGVHGRTIDVVPRIADGSSSKGKTKKSRAKAKDLDTMLDGLLTAARSPPWVAYVFSPSKVKLKKEKMTSEEMDFFVGKVATDPLFRTMAAKEMRETAAFEEELEMNDRVLKAYGEKDAMDFTTLRVVPFEGKRFEGTRLVGIRVPSTGLHYTLQSRCQVPLDRFKFKEATEVRTFVRDITKSIAILHEAGFLHADVKRDNMIYCSARGGRKFRLIDWGASTSVEAMKKGYLGGTYVRPKNSISPIAWFAYGADPVAQWIVLGRAALLHTRAFTYSPEFRQFAADAIESAKEKIEKLIEETGEEAGLGSLEQPRARMLAFERHWKSFDLFNLAFILAEIACTTRGGKKERKRLMRLAYKLV